MSREYKEKEGRWEMEEKQKEGMSSLRLIVSYQLLLLMLANCPRFSYPVESQLLTKGLFNLFTI